MTEHKFTDEEVIMDLQNASEWFKEHGRNTNTAIIGICDRALDLINRQKAEIESLNDMLCGKVTSLAASIEIAEAEERYKAYILSLKAEAIKEFADRLKKYYGNLNSNTAAGLVEYHIDQIAKEMIGDQ